MTAMFGYLPKPSFISLFSYFGYWAIVLLCIGIKVWRGTLTDATKGKKKGGEVEEGMEGGEGADKAKKSAAAAKGDAADDSAIENSSTGGSGQDLPSAAPYLLPVAHKHLPHLGKSTVDEEQPGAAAAAAAADVEAGGAHQNPKRWWQRGKKE